MARPTALKECTMTTRSLRLPKGSPSPHKSRPWLEPEKLDIRRPGRRGNVPSIDKMFQINHANGPASRMVGSYRNLLPRSIFRRLKQGVHHINHHLMDIVLNRKTPPTKNPA